VGGAGGLGEATVRRLHAEGLGVVIADLSADKGKAKRLATLRYAVIAHGGYGVAERIVNRDGSPADLGGFSKTIELYLIGTYNVARHRVTARPGSPTLFRTHA
jgi:NAD(P)-dependent dehydrogenase (short-subunit alcohol dehydrogenase family)